MTDHYIHQLALAVAEANAGALLLNPDNSSDRWVPIADAVESGRAFVVKPKPSLAVFDLDTDELISKGQELARFTNLPVLWIDSGRNRHLYVHGDSKAVYDEARRVYGIPRSAHRTNGVRPPLSPHRLGLPVALIGATVEEGLDVLGPVHELAPFPDWLLRAIANGDDGRFHGNRSSMAMAIASGMKRAGCTVAGFRAVMLNRDNAGGAKAHELEDENRDVEAFIVRTWDRASVGGYRPEIVAAVSAAIDSHGWTGRTARSDHAVMRALVTLADERGTTVPTFGVRTLALRAQLSDKTTCKALGRLVTAGWLRRIKAGHTVGSADGYELRIPRGGSKVPHLLPAPLVPSVVVLPPP